MNIEGATIENRRYMYNFQSFKHFFKFQIVHDCAHILEECYSNEEIIETKIGQLELTKKIFDDILRMKDSGQQKGSSMVLDLNRCNAFSSMEYFMSSAPSHHSHFRFMTLLLILIKLVV